MKRLFQALTGILLGVAVVLWIQGSRGAREERGLEGESHFLSDPFPAPPFSLVAQDGTRVSPASFSGKLLVVFFGFTYCPDVCPLTLANLARAFREMGEEGERIQVLLVTVDPLRDTPERLQEYLSNFHPSFLGLTGTLEEIRSVADGFGAYFHPRGEGEGYTVDHTARTFVVDREGRIPMTFPVTATPGEMARDLALLLERTT